MIMWRAAVLALALTVPAMAQQAPAPRPQSPPAEAEPAAAQPPEAKRPEPKPEPSAQPPAAGAQDPVAPHGGTAPQADPPAVPDGPPMRETLREDDFTYAVCLLDLTLLGADYIEEPAVTDPKQRDCGIARPITLRSALPGVEIPGGALMRCETAWHLAHWLRDFVRPAAAMLPDQPRLVAVEPGTTYQCRATVGNGGQTLSEHAFGNGFDIAAFRFQDGSRIAIEPRQDSGTIAESFQAAIRGAACLHFTTVLGPGSNAAHDDHLHLDIKARKSGWRLCQ